MNEEGKNERGKVFASDLESLFTGCHGSRRYYLSPHSEETSHVIGYGGNDVACRNVLVALILAFIFGEYH